MQQPRHFDVVILGSGFAGSILAAVLAKRQVRVLVVDVARHPRMAIGESSTPLADVTLRFLAKLYDLPLLEQLSTFAGCHPLHRVGSDVPIRVGLKRGFTYYQHETETAYSETTPGDRSMMIAASSSDANGDTHWFRYDVDHLLARMAVESGAELWEEQRVACLDAPNHPVVTTAVLGLESAVNGTKSSITADWVIDATGSASVIAGFEAAARKAVLTHTNCRFAHLRGVPTWSSESQPFDADASAQHHLLGDEGWLWLLRMGDDCTSVGIVGRGDRKPDLRRYPALAKLLRPSSVHELSPGWHSTGRLQQRFELSRHPRILQLPASVMTIDPMHSTGIAHSLVAVARAAEVIIGSARIAEYRTLLNRELDYLDRVVHLAYSMIGDFDRFCASVMIYILGAISNEEWILSRLNDGEHFSSRANEGFFHSRCLDGCDDSGWSDAVQASATALDQVELSGDALNEFFRETFAPWNVAELGSRRDRRYRYTSTK